MAFCIASLLFLFFFIFNDAGDCIDNGGVWDYNQKRCRNDCLTWKRKFGCIPLESDNCFRKKSIWNLEEKRCVNDCNAWKEETACLDKNKPFVGLTQSKEWQEKWQGCHKDCGKTKKEIFCVQWEGMEYFYEL